MTASFNFYLALKDLVGQIPEGMVSTPTYLADALGDRRAARAIWEALFREELRDATLKVVKKPVPCARLFRGFSSPQPLKMLAEFQRGMSERVIDYDELAGTNLVAGVDAAYRGDGAYSVCVVLDSNLRGVESASASECISFPYIPGYLSFREAAVIEAAARRVKKFDVLLVNGHGLAHPRRCGLATHVGLDMDFPTIGVARRLLSGTVGEPVGDWAPIIQKGDVVGAMLEMEGRSPIYVSVGHKISLETSLELVRKTTLGGYLPEPLLKAHIAAEDLKSRSLI
jgi:deoxyribonuclease V